MKKTGITLLLALFLLLSATSVSAETESLFVLRETPAAGSDTVTLQLAASDWFNLLANVFSDDEQLGKDAEITDDGSGGSTVVIHLVRPLREGEEIRILLTASSGSGDPVEASATCTVSGRFPSKLQRLRSRVDDMWPVWRDSWGKAFLEGSVYARVRFDDLPFAAFPDEAPEILVEESGDTARVWISETIPEDWSLSLAFGIPVELVSCEWDEKTGAYVGPSGFDQVYLASASGAERIGITIGYERSEQFLASWPVVEWVESAEEPAAFNCYGFGTARHYDGGMFAAVGPGAAWVLEYDAGHGLTSLTNLVTGCVYTPAGKLISGEEPEGFVFPCVIW